MAEVKQKPAGLPTGNDLDKFKEAPPPQAEIRLGANVLMNMAHPPQIGETRDVVIRLRCTMTGHEQRTDDGDPTPFCRTRIIAAWEWGKPKPDESQLSIDDIDGDEDSDDADGDEGSAGKTDEAPDY